MADLKNGAHLEYTAEGRQDTLVVSDRVTKFRGSPWWKFNGRDRIFIPTGQHESKSSLDDSSLDEDNTVDDSVYNNARAHEIYKPIENYEGRHRFDLTATWSDDEEKKLIRKVSISLYSFQSASC